MHVEIGGKAPRRAPFSLGRFLIYSSIYFSSIYIYIYRLTCTLTRICSTEYIWSTLHLAFKITCKLKEKILFFWVFFENNWEKIVEINPKTCKQGAFYNNNLRLS